MIAVLVFFHPASLRADIISPKPPVVVDLGAYIKEQAKEKDIDYDHFNRTLACESENFKDVAMQSEYPDATGPNGREDSWGVAQIHLPDNPGITREMAQDPLFAIAWAAQRFKDGYAERWTCFRNKQANSWK